MSRSRQAGTRRRSGRALTTRPEVNVRWRQLPRAELKVEQAARNIAEIVLGHSQRRLDSPRLHPVGELCGGAASQSGEPLSYFIDGEKVVGYHWNGQGSLSLVLASGEVVNGKARGADEPSRIFAQVKAESPRAKPTIHIRPGQGGNPRRSLLNEDGADPTDGLEEYARNINWQTCPGGALMAVIGAEPGRDNGFDPEGDSVILCRLSNEDENQRLVLQVDPCFALVRQHAGQLRPRYAILAVNMSGAREVRPNRAGPPPPGELERDDMVLLDEWIAEGWVEHIVARGADRIAREMLPGETLLQRWAKNDIGLWLARHGRRMDYEKDRSLLRLEMFMSAEERAGIAQRTQNGLIEKGPLAGVGWLGTKPFGFLREKQTRKLRQDPEQWPWILRTFELADVGNGVDAEGLSYRRVTDRLALEGCPFDEERVRQILHDPIYATGEFVVNLRGVPVPQTPIELDNPVPLDRWLRVQTLLALRQGQTSRTPLGEFILNHVQCLHLQCEDERNSREQRPLLKGYIFNRPGGEDVRRYRHSPFVPSGCKKGGRGAQGSYTWERDDLEPPIIAAVRELAGHPEVLAALATADRHEIAPTNGRLSDAQRQKLEQELAEARSRVEAASDEWAEQDLRAGGKTDFELFKKMVGGLQRKAETLEARLAADDQARARDEGVGESQRDRRLTTFLEIMTVETPEDPLMRALRARLFQRCVNRVEIDDDGEGPITITLYGHFVPEGASLESRDPVAACADLLDSVALKEAGKTPRAEAEVARVEQVKTALPDKAEKAVSTLMPQLASLPSNRGLARLRRQTLADAGWRNNPRRRSESGVPGWRCSIVVDPVGDPAAQRLERITKACARVPYYQELLELLESGGGERSRVELVGTLGWTESTLSRRTGQLMDWGLIERINVGPGSRVTFRLLAPTSKE